MRKWLRLSPALVISLLALFVALAGVSVAATGGNFILGMSNTADQQTQLTGSVANPQLRVENSSTANGAVGIVGKITAAGAPASSAGLKGTTAATDPAAAAVVGTNLGGGPALSAVVNPGAPPLKVNSSTKVDNLNSDKVDGASILSNRIVSQTQFDHILDVPGFGAFYVDGCDHTNVRFGWNSGGPNAYVSQGDIMNPSDASLLFQGVANVFVSTTRPRLFRVIQLARDTGTSTSIATVTVTAHAVDCVFAAQAIVQPG